jgi:hypothetical protein
MLETSAFGLQSRRFKVILIAILIIFTFSKLDEVKACDVIWCEEIGDGYNQLYAGE